MMKKKQSTWWRMTWIAVTLPLVGIALTAFSKPKEALKEVVDSSVEIIEQPIVEALSSDVEAPEVRQTPAPEPVKEIKAADNVKAGDKITGTVKDAAGPLLGANIVEIDQFGRIVANTVSDVNGNFVLKVKDPKNKIRISYVGFKSQELDIKDATVNVTLESNTKIIGTTVHTQPLSIDNNAPHFKDEYPQTGDEGTFMMVEKNPTFPGGNEKIYNYLAANLRYPSVTREMLTEGEVTVEFTVGKTGLIRSPKVIEVKASSPLVTIEISQAAKNGNEEAIEIMKAYDDAIEAMKEEAIHVVRNMSRWEPGRQNGKRVETSYTLPVNFKLAQ